MAKHSRFRVTCSEICSLLRVTSHLISKLSRLYMYMYNPCLIVYSLSVISICWWTDFRLAWKRSFIQLLLFSNFTNPSHLVPSILCPTLRMDVTCKTVSSNAWCALSCELPVNICVFCLYFHILCAACFIFNCWKWATGRDISHPFLWCDKYTYSTTCIIVVKYDFGLPVRILQSLGLQAMLHVLRVHDRDPWWTEHANKQINKHTNKQAKINSLISITEAYGQYYNLVSFLYTDQ